MPNVSIADARAKPMAVEAARKPIDVAALRDLIAAHPAPEGADKDFDAVRYLRDDARY